jgi:choline kinase
VILAAGRGRRIAGANNDAPKSYLEVGGKRLIDWQIEQYRQLGVSEIIVVVGYQRARFLEDYKDLTLVFNPFYETTNVLTSFWFAAARLHEDTIFSHADTIFERDVLQRLLATDGDIVLPYDRRTCGAEEMKVSLDGDRIVLVTKDMPPENCDGEFIGLAKLSRAVLPQINAHAERFMERKQFDRYFEAAVQEVIKDDRASVVGVDITGLRWTEVDFPEDYERARQLFETT